jgi:hypothetical protein
MWQQQCLLVNNTSIHACTQVFREPQWRFFKSATDLVPPNSFLPNPTRPFRSAGSPTADMSTRCGKEQRLKVGGEVVHLYRRQHAFCTALAYRMNSYIQVPSHVLLHGLFFLFVELVASVVLMLRFIPASMMTYPHRLTITTNASKPAPCHSVQWLWNMIQNDHLIRSTSGLKP